MLVTGHTGFKGSWLTAALVRAGAVVTGLALAPQGEINLFSLLRLDGEIDSRIGDICDLSATVRVIRDANPEFAFHLAAQSLVRAGYDHPLDTYRTNVMGTLHVLEALRGVAGVRACVVVTSDKCYRNDERDVPFVESDALGGEDPYSSSKAAAEIVTHAYRASYEIAGGRVATGRAGNVIGGGDWASERLVPDIVSAARAGEAPVLRYPASVRPWQHVLEPLAGYVLLAQRLADDAGLAGGWNFGPGAPLHLTVAELTEALLTALGRPPRWSLAGEPQPREARVLRLDSHKARTMLGWRTRLDDREMLEWTARWYRAWMLGEDVRALTYAQIEEYANR